MLTTAKDIQDCKLAARDGEIGSVEDLYFDDQDWTIRYLVLETGGWLSGRQVLISPRSAGPPDVASHALPVHLTKDQIENSPPVDTALPVSREQEERMASYYGWPSYWAYGMPPAEAVLPPYAAAGVARQRAEAETRGQPQLRSMKEVTGYTIQANDAEFGHVDDFIVDDEYWTVRYLVVDTRTLLPGKKVLIAPVWIDRVTWAERAVRVDLPLDLIRSAPSYDRDTTITRDFERAIFRHYSRPAYWRES